MTIKEIIVYLESRVDQDGKNGKDLTLYYIIGILQELDESR